MWKILEPKQNIEESYLLSVAERKALVDIYGEAGDIKDFLKKTVLQGKHYNRAAIIAFYKRLEQVNQKALSVMREVKPTTVTAFKTAMKAEFPDIAATAMEYVVDKMIQHSNEAKDCSYTTFKTYFSD
jgi:hypothetical protein